MRNRMDSYILILHTLITMVAIVLFLAYTLNSQDEFKAIARVALFLMVITTGVCLWRLMQLNFDAEDNK